MRFRRRDRRGANRDEMTETSTPAGLQLCETLAHRRRVTAACNLSLYAALALWLATILRVEGWSGVDIAFFICFLLASPWAVVGFVNAVLGLWLLRFSPDGLRRAAPFADPALSADTPPERIAVVMTLRNEDCARAFTRFEAIEEELSQVPEADRFSFHVLSDTSLDAVAEDEARHVAAWRARRPRARIFYRRRTHNKGFKAGNLRDFCRAHYDDVDAMIALDADSRMSAAAILRLARIAARWPRIGILQSLVVGAPSSSAFARLFQFGMRHGMRSYTMGAAWWGGDCGPFWGHNALVRVKPFHDHCELPVLPGRPPLGGPILSHDQVEAVLMRRAGYEARVLPIETQSFEDNPPDMIEFSRRDMRWCQGNMQYGPLLRLEGLKPTSRFQLAWAMLMFLGLPASQALILLGALKPFDGETLFPVGSAVAFWAVYLLVGLAPKLCGLADIALGRETARYGGAALFWFGALAELVASFLLSAAVGFRTSLFMLGLPFGAGLGWGAQQRDGQGLSWTAAARAFWPGTLFGLAVVVLLAAGAPGALIYAAPYVAGLVLAIPFAHATAARAVGIWMTERKLCATPEEIAASR